MLSPDDIYPDSWHYPSNSLALEESRPIRREPSLEYSKRLASPYDFIERRSTPPTRTLDPSRNNNPQPRSNVSHYNNSYQSGAPEKRNFLSKNSCPDPAIAEPRRNQKPSENTRRPVLPQRKDSSRSAKRSSWEIDPNGSNVKYVGPFSGRDLEAQSTLHGAFKDDTMYVPGPSFPPETKPLPPNTTPPPSPKVLYGSGGSPLPPVYHHEKYDEFGHRYLNLPEPTGDRIIYRNPLQRVCPMPQKPFKMERMCREASKLLDRGEYRNVAIQSFSQTYEDYLRLSEEVGARFEMKRRNRRDQAVGQEHKYFHRLSQQQPTRPVIPPLPPLPPKDHHSTAFNQQRTKPTRASPRPQERRTFPRTVTPHPPGHFPVPTKLACNTSQEISDPESEYDGSYDDSPDDLVDASSGGSSSSQNSPDLEMGNVSMHEDGRLRSKNNAQSNIFARRLSNGDGFKRESSNPPTCFIAFRALYVVESTLHQIDFLGLDHIVVVEDALLVAQDCLRRQRNLTHDQWKERTHDWDIDYTKWMERMRHHIDVINYLIEDPATSFRNLCRTSRDLQRVADLLHIYFDQLEQKFLEKQSKIWATVFQDRPRQKTSA